MNYALVLVVALLLAGCATSMTPSQFMEEFPRTTQLDFYDRAHANSALSDGFCKLLVSNRRYLAPLGVTVSDDVRYGAKGVDEWVRLDGGNAYMVNRFEWISVDGLGSAQLAIDFDTMLCGESLPGRIEV